MKALYTMLLCHHNYDLSYDALRRYIRRHYPEILKKGARLRIETPPGALMQVDWKENVSVQIGGIGNWVKIQFLCFLLCFSRKMKVRVSEKKDLPAFIRCHQQAFRSFGGLPAWIRPDCLRSAVVRWYGERSVLNERYEKYLNDLGIGVLPSRPGTPTDKGKVEKRIQDLFCRLDLKKRIFSDFSDLQLHIDGVLSVLENEWSCGATGLSIAKSFDYEKQYLQCLPDIFPALPVAEKRTVVRRDGTVYFAGNYYQVPQIYIDKQVLCLHTGEQIRIFHAGDEIECFSHLPGTKGMVRLSQQAISEASTPLSERVRRWSLEVASRQMEMYQQILQEAL
jgi:hypothetical protein